MTSAVALRPRPEAPARPGRHISPRCTWTIPGRPTARLRAQRVDHACAWSPAVAVVTDPRVPETRWVHDVCARHARTCERYGYVVRPMTVEEREAAGTL